MEALVAKSRACKRGLKRAADGAKSFAVVINAAETCARTIAMTTP
jgi:hypothetical protein